MMPKKFIAIITALSLIFATLPVYAFDKQAVNYAEQMVLHSTASLSKLEDINPIIPVTLWILGLAIIHLTNLSVDTFDFQYEDSREAFERWNNNYHHRARHKNDHFFVIM